ncbi:hypothetical protein [Planosporangium sp. 12N6]|uniref:hypothetical protein n=1 Tax=Planosporangium spinosum TaxID=3402278 RepID=UPI003CECD5E9
MRRALVAVAVFSMAFAVNAKAAAGSVDGAEETLRWVSVEEYGAATGLSLEAIRSMPSASLPDRFHIELSNGTFTESLSKESPIPGGEAAGPTPQDTGTPGVNWWGIVWGGNDWNGTYVPIRLGTDSWGYQHYYMRHNLYSTEPFKAALRSHGPDAQGNYTAVLVDNALMIRETVVFGVQLATRTSDGAYTTPDGKYIGVITGYCKGKNVCPDAVNRVPVP